MTAASTALPTIGRRQGGGRRRAGLAVYLIVGTVASIAFVLPLAWAVFRSLLPDSLVTAAPGTTDLHHLTFSNYSGLIRGQDILHYALNSLLVTVLTAAGAVIAMIPCVVLYVALQRYYIRGLTSGVVKS
jgi:ABC-type glycerol-3-phosphate transport system permease component